MSDSEFDLSGRVAIVTGASGVLGSVAARALSRAGATVVAVARRADRLEVLVDGLRESGDAAGIPADVTEVGSLQRLRDSIAGEYRRLDILVNAAGGNRPEATLPDGGDVFALSPEAIRQALELNFFGTLNSIQTLGPLLAAADCGVITNISSMTVERAVTRVVGYSASKAALENLTRWLAVDLGRRFDGALRVNAVAPGFFVAEQNRQLLIDDDGELTDRGRTITAHTPAGRFGLPEELAGTIVWLCSDASRFVTGAVIPVDGGFSAFSGV